MPSFEFSLLNHPPSVSFLYLNDSKNLAPLSSPSRPSSSTSTLHLNRGIQRELRSIALAADGVRSVCSSRSESPTWALKMFRTGAPLEPSSFFRGKGRSRLSFGFRHFVPFRHYKGVLRLRRLIAPRTCYGDLKFGPPLWWFEVCAGPEQLFPPSLASAAFLRSSTNL